MENRTVHVGYVNDVVVTATVSRKSAFSKIAAQPEVPFAVHVALSTEKGYLWSEIDRLSIFGTDLLKCWEVNWKKAVRQLFPELTEEQIGELEWRGVVNSPGAAKRQDVHAHILLALRSVWASGIIPRVVAPLEPIPPEEREG